MTKTNTRLPESAVRHPLTPTSRFVDDVVIGGGVPTRVRRGPNRPAAGALHQPAIGACLGRPRVYGRPDCFYDQSWCALSRDGIYALPVEHVVPALEEVSGALITRRGWRIEFRSKCARGRR